MGYDPVFRLRNELDDQMVASRGFSLARGALHEFYASAHADRPVLSALAMMLGEAEKKAAILWVRQASQDLETGAPHPAGLSELGLDPARILLLRAPDARSVLQAGLEGARCPAFGAVIMELWGETRAYDLTASRRLALAAKASSVPLFLLRIAAKPAPSAAETRWLARAAPSRALAAQAPGRPAFHLTLLRAQNGQEGARHFLEWNRDARRLESRFSGSGETDCALQPDDRQPAPLSRLVAPVSFDRPGAARDEPFPQRQAG